MGMPETAGSWTAEMVRALPADGTRYEVVDGELFVTPAPSFDHQEAVAQLWARVQPYVKAHVVGHAAMSPADVELDPHTLVQPDLFVVPLTDGRRPKRWSDVTGLILAVEVLSPSSARADRTVKRRLYQRAGVAEYWIVDLDGRLVERWRPADERPELLAETLDWRPVGTAEPLTLDLPRFFADVLGD